MKIISLLLLCGIAYLHAAPTEAPIDYRERYDHLLMEMINERIRSGEAFMEHLSHQLKEFQTTKKEDVREHIVKELEFIMPLLKAADQYFVTELKKTGLDMLEKYSVNKAKQTVDLLVKLFTEVQTQVAKKPAFYAVTANPEDYRKEYDRLLFQTINEHITRADGALLMLNRQLDQYLKTKDAEIKDRIIKEVDLFVPLLKAADDHAKTELKRTDLNRLERFLYEKAADEVALLIKHYSMIETQVKGGKPVSMVFAATAAPVHDWRSDYDKLLFEFVEENVRRADGFLVELVRQFNQYLETKDKSLVQRIATEVDFAVPMVKRGIEMAENELKRTDLNHVERYLFEKVRDEATILMKHYTQLEAEVKKA